jgi:hypothetical protein
MDQDGIVNAEILSQCSNAAAAAPFEGMKVKYVILIYFD